MTRITIEVHLDDPDEPDLLFRTDDMALRGRPATIGGVEGTFYELLWFVATPPTLEDLLDTIGPG